ncbi:MAG TPA: 6-bladed beta-propeller [Gemmatimonadaceae bacterium]|nr:6-bladed beta-propeller [Gemmatimonadaceae bacterium]
MAHTIRRISRRASVAFWAPLLALASCGEPVAEGQMHGRLAGLATVVPTERLRLGGPDAEEPAAFMTIAGAVAGPDGMLYVLDAGRVEVIVFDDTGAFVRRIGGRGQGPGEIGAPSRMGFLADTLWILDWLRQTTHFFGKSGEFLHARRIAIGLDSTRFTRPTLPLGLLEHGRALFEGDPRSSEPPLATGPVVHANLDGSGGDTLFSRRVWRGRVPVPGAGALRVAAIENHPLVALDSRGRRVVAIGRGPADDVGQGIVHVTVWSSRGDTILSKPLAGFARRRVGAAARDSIRRGAVEALRRTMAQLPQLQSSIADPERVIDGVLHVAEEFPPVDDVRAASDGSLWLRLTAPGANQTWLALDREAEPRRLVRLPSEFTLHDAHGTRIWCSITDSLDVPYIIGLDLPPGT